MVPPITYIFSSVSILFILKILNAKRNKKDNSDVIMMIDERIDHQFTLMDLISPKINVFDKP